MDQLRYLLGVEHRFTTAHAPWSNGIVERIGRSLRETLSALVSETKLHPSSWPDMIPAVTSILNQSPSTALRGSAPITAFTGRKPMSPLSVIFDSHSESVTPLPLTDSAVAETIRALESSFDAIISAVEHIPARPNPTRPGEKSVDFDVRDYVLVARQQVTKYKTAPIWNGPARVVAAENDRAFKVRDLITNKERIAHADQL
jgi:hypothetical protein